MTNAKNKIKQEEHKKLKLPGKGPYKVIETFEESNTIKIRLNKKKDLIVNLKNVKKYFSRPEWMKQNEEILEEKVNSEEEMDKKTSQDIEQDQPMSQSEITEIFDALTQNLISLLNIEEPGNFGIRVEVEVLQQG
jgi:hypothetical protein